jgi:hypothetical protein
MLNAAAAARVVNTDSQTYRKSTPAARPELSAAVLEGAPRNTKVTDKYVFVLLRLDEDVKRKVFNGYVSTWLKDTQWHSSIGSIVKHPLFSRIVNLRESGAKFILERMSAGDVHPHWFPALKDIAGQFDPVPPYDRGRVSEMTKHWLEWGKSKGFIDRNA